MRELLRLERLTKNFGGLMALNRVSFSVREGAIKGLIGPNGAGKTTAFNLITGIHPPSGGAIFFDGRRIDGLPPHRLSRLGLARTFQTVRLFPGLTVLENVMVGRHARMTGGLLRSLYPFGGAGREERAAGEAAMEALALVGLAGRWDAPAGTLPFGLQRLVEIARALATEPRLLLLDEPAAGLGAEERNRLKLLIRALRDRGLTILLIEHDVGMVLDLADEVVVLEYGAVIAEGEPSAIRSHPEVVRAYLGLDSEPGPSGEGVGEVC